MEGNLRLQTIHPTVPSHRRKTTGAISVSNAACIWNACKSDDACYLKHCGWM
jgi:hypothetical protein